MLNDCFFCNAPLGSNDEIEHCQQGRRLAFEIDVERSRRAGLKPSAALLGLARNLRQPLN